ncbi:M4 family metallopeptidase [Brevibacterium marinum]|uniref:Neutral metalloproteinase n=1 Tax=Brevibacterium marinum TaxID=418643 RepID=A0A846RXR0_9MICO|nr:M4 family metallopeptidase [Brevibacterium marinum]NJC56215.1 Zn-dependent metalloprotease [Brevibacterium marinum]
MSNRHVIPPYLLDSLAERGGERFPRAARAARSARMSDESSRSLRAEGLRYTPLLEDSESGSRGAAGSATGASGVKRIIHDAQGTETLPGVLVRSEGEEPVSDEAVNEAYDGLGASYSLFAEVFDRDSLDGKGMPLIASVHYGQDYDNAFFDGRLMVFGDGDDEVFTGFTGSLSIIGHELSHGVISHTADLEYSGQPGALNEHCADVFGALTEQHDAGQSADQATWLIGAGVFTPDVTGQALRSMIAPGTAYDDDVLGTDPQPDHMNDFITTDSDNGGVHLNSGIPNRAFALAATNLGGRAWETVGQVWFAVLVGSQITTRTDFAGFAALTIAEAAAAFGEGSDVHDALVQSWDAVGVTRAAGRGNVGSGS